MSVVKQCRTCGCTSYTALGCFICDCDVNAIAEDPERRRCYGCKPSPISAGRWLVDPELWKA
jgi:hypothetical protein